MLPHGSLLERQLNVKRPCALPARTQLRVSAQHQSRSTGPLQQVHLEGDPTGCMQVVYLTNKAYRWLHLCDTGRRLARCGSGDEGRRCCNHLCNQPALALMTGILCDMQASASRRYAGLGSIQQQQQQASHRHRLPPPCFTEAEDAGEVTENRVIVVTSGKGGVGKTTASANLGMSIAR